PVDKEHCYMPLIWVLHSSKRFFVVRKTRKYACLHTPHNPINLKIILTNRKRIIVMNNIKMTTGEFLPLEMHKARIVQNLTLEPIEERIENMKNAGNNMFLLNNRDVFLDMLTDSGVNAMSDKQQAAMMQADDSYAGSETFFRLKKSLVAMFQKDEFLPAHQGRACENILAAAFVKKGQIVPMNYHFTTTKAHITSQGGSVLEIPVKEAMDVTSDVKFKGNMDIDALKKAIADNPKDKIALWKPAQI
ncbi:MAG: beta-eliminating lyase-related protein, partial [Oscillospiraceae bacterium]